MPAKKDGNRIYTAMYLDRDQHAALHELSKKTHAPLAAYFREAIDDLLAKHKVRRAKR